MAVAVGVCDVCTHTQHPNPTPSTQLTIRRAVAPQQVLRDLREPAPGAAVGGLQDGKIDTYMYIGVCIHDRRGASTDPIMRRSTRPAPHNNNTYTSMNHINTGHNDRTFSRRTARPSGGGCWSGARPSIYGCGVWGRVGVVCGSCRVAPHLSIPTYTSTPTIRPTNRPDRTHGNQNHNTYIHQSHPYISLCITTGPQGPPLPRRRGGALAVVHGGRGGGGAPGEAAWVAGGGGARGERGRESLDGSTFMCVCVCLCVCVTHHFTPPPPPHTHTHDRNHLMPKFQSNPTDPSLGVL